LARQRAASDTETAAGQPAASIRLNGQNIRLARRTSAKLYLWSGQFPVTNLDAVSDRDRHGAVRREVRTSTRPVRRYQPRHDRIRGGLCETEGLRPGDGAGTIDLGDDRHAAAVQSARGAERKRDAAAAVQSTCDWGEPLGSRYDPRRADQNGRHHRAVRL